MKKLVLGALGFFLALLVISNFLPKTEPVKSIPEKTEGQSVAESENAARIALKTQEEHTVNAKSLLAEYEANKNLADTKYKDKPIYIEGTIDLINTRSTYSYYLTLKGSEFGPSVLCSLENKDKLPNLRQGDYIAVHGICKGFSTDVHIFNSHVVPTLAASKEALSKN
jgi:hypothetical protein